MSLSIFFFIIIIPPTVPFHSLTDPQQKGTKKIFLYELVTAVHFIMETLKTVSTRQWKQAFYGTLNGIG